MLVRVKYIISIVGLLGGLCLSQAQQPSVYKIDRMTFNDPAYSDISPVIINGGIVFCSDRRFSAMKDRKSFEGNRIYNIYKAERKDTNDFSRPVMIKSDRSELFNCGPLYITPDGNTVYFTSEVETGKATRKRNFRNYS